MKRLRSALASLLAAATLCVWSSPAASAARGGAAQPPEPAPGRHHHPEHGEHDGEGERTMQPEVDVHRPGMKHDFSDVDRHADSFDSPERAAWQKPDHVLELMEVAFGMTVADLGAGTGFFEPALARAVGPSGRVLALDVEPKMVEHLKRRAGEAGLTQVEARLVEPDDPGLEPASVDRILVVNTWHHIDDRGAYAAKLREALAEGGSIWVVDFEKESAKGPPASHKLAPREVIAELEAGGLRAAQIDEELAEQYIVIARPR